MTTAAPCSSSPCSARSSGSGIHTTAKPRVSLGPIAPERFLEPHHSSRPTPPHADPAPRPRIPSPFSAPRSAPLSAASDHRRHHGLMADSQRNSSTRVDHAVPSALAAARKMSGHGLPRPSGTSSESADMTQSGWKWSKRCGRWDCRVAVDQASSGNGIADPYRLDLEIALVAARRYGDRDPTLGLMVPIQAGQINSQIHPARCASEPTRCSTSSTAPWSGLTFLNSACCISSFSLR